MTNTILAQATAPNAMRAFNSCLTKEAARAASLDFITAFCAVQAQKGNLDPIRRVTAVYTLESGKLNAAGKRIIAYLDYHAFLSATYDGQPRRTSAKNEFTAYAVRVKKGKSEALASLDVASLPSLSEWNQPTAKKANDGLTLSAIIKMADKDLSQASLDKASRADVAQALAALEKLKAALIIQGGKNEATAEEKKVTDQLIKLKIAKQAASARKRAS